MKRFILLLVVGAISLSAVSAFAQKSWLGVQGDFVLPTNDLKEITKSGGGGGFFWEFAISKAFQTRVDATWLQFSSRELSEDVTSQVRLIPARVGLNWLFGPEEGTRFYLGAMAGAYFQRVSLDVDGDGSAQEETFFGVAPSLGIIIPVGPNGNRLEISASYDVYFDETTSSGEELNTGFVRLGVGYGFGM